MTEKRVRYPNVPARKVKVRSITLISRVYRSTSCQAVQAITYGWCDTLDCGVCPSSRPTSAVYSAESLSIPNKLPLLCCLVEHLNECLHKAVKALEISRHGAHIEAQEC